MRLAVSASASAAARSTCTATAARWASEVPMPESASRPREVRMAHMSWTDYRGQLEANDAVVLTPVGAIEQHGPHLPLATDTLIPQRICEAVAVDTGGLVAPALTYGSKSVPRCGGGQHFCGTTSL